MSVYDIITNRLIEKMESGKIPWSRPWQQGIPPSNYITRKPYRGINMLLLSTNDYQAPWYLTYKQVSKLGGTIKPEEYKKAELVVFYKQYKQQNDESEESSRVSNQQNKVEQDNNESQDSHPKYKAVLRYYRVWNIEQTTLDYELPKVNDNNKPLEQCEDIVANMPTPPRIVHRDDTPCYIPAEDIVRLPTIDKFTSADHYYSTLFHELVHSTGHKKRLCRDSILQISNFGSYSYGVEELTAEIGAGFLCHHANIDQKTIENQAAYLQSWSNTIKANKRLIFSAAAKAQKAADWIMQEQSERSELCA